MAACAGCSCRASNPAMRARSEAYLNHLPPSRANRSAAASFWAPLLVIETLVARRMVGRTVWAGWRAAGCGYNTSKPTAVRSLCFANLSCAFWGVFACRCVSQEFLGGPEFCSLLGFGTPRLYLYPRTPECGCRHVFPCVHFYLDIRRSGAVICCNLTRLDAFLRLIVDYVWDFFARLLAAADIRAPICDALVLVESASIFIGVPHEAKCKNKNSRHKNRYNF